MQTKIIDVNVEWVGAGAKKYGKAVVTHDAGKGEKKQTLVSFKNPDVFKKVQELVGQEVNVEMTKEGDFWQWKSITAAAGGSPAASAPAATRVGGSNYETKEERAARQVLIVKQSSLSAAIALMSPGAKSALDPKAVVETAQFLTDWVFATAPIGDVSEMSDDIPF